MPPEALQAGDLVTVVVEDSPADQAGLQPGDIVIRVDNTQLDDMSVKEAVAEYEPGDVIESSVRTDDGSLDLGVQGNRVAVEPR